MRRYCHFNFLGPLQVHVYYYVNIADDTRALLWRLLQAYLCEVNIDNR